MRGFDVSFILSVMTQRGQGSRHILEGRRRDRPLTCIPRSGLLVTEGLCRSALAFTHSEFSACIRLSIAAIRETIPTYVSENTEQ